MPVHLRLNDKDTSRNPFINFVTALPGPRHDEALRRLQQLAAMAKPLMKDQGFHINSLEEYEFNREFAGRCWNNGEVIELVLTSEDGNWRPLQFVLYVFCHELAHIKHMNHIPHLHGALTRRLKQLALEKQSQGYFGDGVWSSGRRLEGGGFVSGQGMNHESQDLPQQVCGGAFRRQRAQKPQRRRSGRGGGGGGTKGAGSGGRKFKGPSLHTGAQTASNARGGGNRRVKLDVQEKGSGNRVDGKDWTPVATSKSKDYKLDENSTFRKRTQSKDAREKRAAAALARFATVQSTSAVKEEPPVKEEEVKRNDGEDESVTEDEGSSDSSSAIEEVDRQDGGEDDTWLVGNDLNEDMKSRIKLESFGLGQDEGQQQQQHFTQADQDETAEQRRRRMKRFDEKSGGGGTGNDNEWDSLLNDRNGKRKVKQEDSDEDVVIVDNGASKRTMPIKGVKRGSTTTATTAPSKVSRPALPSSAAIDVAPSDEWSCLLCTLRNPRNAQRCAVCETSKGKMTLGS
ncbi:hypothetical protein CBS101457_001839 [Exobasidium rhododendri]|nr:hypothetical protein CBS101457_001839 [Exobasidium rhododendri]